VTPPDTRAEVPTSGDERALLLAFLDFHRETLRWKCAGLSAAHLATAAAPPSDMSLLGIVRHVATVEADWFEDYDAALPVRADRPPRDWDADWAVDPATVTEADCAAAWSTWHAAVDRSRRIVAAARSLDTMVDGYSLRWVLIHMIEEYARHNGHADLLRQALDGAVGE